MQYEIFKMLTENKQGLYFVGDIKQSIYGFRGAQPSVFSAICKSDDFDKLPLNENFRSNRCVIDGINTLFDRMMTEENGGVDYAENGRLICGLERTATARFPMRTRRRSALFRRKTERTQSLPRRHILRQE